MRQFNNIIVTFEYVLGTADCTLGENLIKSIDAIALLADHGYDVFELFPNIAGWFNVKTWDCA